MKKILLSFIFALFLVPLSITKIGAVSLSPNTGTYAPGQNITLEVRATPQAGEVGLELQLQITGGTITNFVPASGFTVSSGTCSGSVSFTANTICHVYANATAFTNGQSLGTISLTVGSSGSIVFLASGTEYATETNTRESAGQVASYTISTQQQQLPATSLFSGNKDELFLALGLISLSIACALMATNIIRSKNNLFK